MQSLSPDYHYIKPIGEGSYGKVFLYQHKPSQQFKAVKQIKFKSDEVGVPQHALREITTLKFLNHRNVINLENVVYD